MSCEELRKATLSYLERQLSPSERSALEEHARACPGCERYLAVARETTCRHVAEFLSEFIEGSLPASEAKVFERHMGLCPPCVDYLAALRVIIRAGRTCAGERPPAIPEALVQAILKARPR